MATLYERLDELCRLPANWDGYGADPIRPDIIAWAKEFVAYFDALAAKTGGPQDLAVFPTRVGGVQLEWTDPSYEHELELMPDGSIEMLRVETATGEMVTETFRPGPTATAPGFMARLGQLASAAA